MNKPGINVVKYPADSEEYRRLMEAQSERHRELDLLRRNNWTYQFTIEQHEKHIAILKKQVVDLQAELLAAQDRIAELQQQLLDLRQSAERT